MNSRIFLGYGLLSVFVLVLVLIGMGTFVSGEAIPAQKARRAFLPPQGTPRFLFAETAGDISKILKSHVPVTASPTAILNFSRSSPVESSALIANLSTRAPGPVFEFRRSTTSTMPSVHAAGWLVGDLLSGDVYISQNADKRWPLASITKLMSAVVLLRAQGGGQTIVTIPPTAASETGDTNATGLVGGSRYRASDLLNVMLVASSNDAAVALATHHGFQNFVAEMNAAARDWGLADTYFDEPTGLSVSDESTPRDVFRFLSKIYGTYPEILQTTRKQSVAIADVDSNLHHVFPSTNSFAGRADFIGGKTGFTDDARGNLVSVFSVAKRPVVVIVLGTEDRFGETEKLFTWVRTNFKTSPSAT